MPFVKEKLLRFVLVLVGLGTLGGFGWRMYDFMQNRQEITAALDLKRLEGTFGTLQSKALGSHLHKYAEYKVLQELNITGYVPPPEVEPTAHVKAPIAVLASTDVEVPLIQAPSAAWIQGRGEAAGQDQLAGAFRVVGDTFELETKPGLKLRLKSVQVGFVEIEIIDSGEVVQVRAADYPVDPNAVLAKHAHKTDAEATASVEHPDEPGFVYPERSREVEPNLYAVGTADIRELESMSEEQLLASVPVRVKRDPLSNEVVGLRIKSVPAGSVFERLGLKAEDVVLEVNGQPAVDRDDLFQAVSRMDTDTLKVQVERLGGVRTLTFRLP